MKSEETDRRPIPARRLNIVKRIARRLHEFGIAPNQISVFGLIACLLAGLLLALTSLTDPPTRTFFFLSALLVFLRGLANMFDGMVAVELEQATPTGGLFNEIPDRVSDIGLFVGAGFALGGSPYLGFIAAIMAVLIAFVRVAARNAGAPSDFGGWMAKQQRMFLLAGASLWLALAPDTWPLAIKTDANFGLISICLLLVALGGVQTVTLRLHRAGSYLKTSTTKSEVCS